MLIQLVEMVRTKVSTKTSNHVWISSLMNSHRIERGFAHNYCVTVLLCPVHIPQGLTGWKTTRVLEELVLCIGRSSNYTYWQSLPIMHGNCNDVFLGRESDSKEFKNFFFEPALFYHIPNSFRILPEVLVHPVQRSFWKFDKVNYRFERLSKLLFICLFSFTSLLKNQSSCGELISV